MDDKEFLIKSLLRDGYLRTPRIISAFEKIDRKDFILPETIDEAYGNYPLSIGHGQTISQPLTVAFMLELLEPKPGEKILDVGSGSGWTSALLAYVVSNAARINADSDADKPVCRQAGADKNISENQRNNPRTSAGRVVAIERIPELCKFGEANVRKYGFIEKGTVKFYCGDGSRGYEAEAPYDKILAGASGDEIPEAWKRQLKVGGRIVAPVGQSVIVLDKISEREFKEKEYFGFSFVPLVRG